MVILSRRGGHEHRNERGFGFRLLFKHGGFTGQSVMKRRQNYHVLPPNALALLAAQPPSYSTSAYIVSTWRKQPRLLQIRANVLLVFCGSAEADLSNVQLVVVLSASSHLQQLAGGRRCKNGGGNAGEHLVNIGDHSFYFRHPQHAAALRSALLGVVDHHCHYRRVRPSSKLACCSPTSSSESLSSSSAVSELDMTKKSIMKSSLSSSSSAAAACLPRYSVVRVIGNGSSGVVHAARMNGCDDLFAIKTIPNSSKNSKTSMSDDHSQQTNMKYDLMLSPTSLHSVVSERLFLQRAAEQRCPFIVQLVDAFETKSSFHLVTKLAHWGNLQHILSHVTHRRLPERVARVVFAELVAALVCTHGMGYLYRDMKMSNVLITRNGHVQLGDFGLCKQVRVRDSHSYPRVMNGDGTSGKSVEVDALFEKAQIGVIGRAKSFVGTRVYMAPEQIAVEASGNSSYGAPADIWGLGIILYTLLTGTHPFVGRRTSSSSSSSVDDRNDDDDDDKLFGDGYDDMDHNTLTWNIVNQRISIPSLVSQSAEKLLRLMLCRDESKRIDLCHIMTHEWLAEIDWSALFHSAQHDLSLAPVVDFLRAERVTPIVPVRGTENEDEDEDEEEVDSFGLRLDKEFARRTEECFDSSLSSSCRDEVPSLLGFSYLPR